MYQGKFDQKQKKSTSTVSEIVSQRNAASVKEAPARREAPARNQSQTAARAQAPARNSAPAKNQQAPARKPARQAPAQPAPEPVPEKRKGPRLGGVIFYTLYFLFIFLFFVAAFFGLRWLQSWLVDFEKAQPTVKSEQVFTQLFADPDWEALYTAAGVQDTTFEGKEAYVSYMEQKMGDSQLTYLKTSAGLSEDEKYNVMLNGEKIASFTLTDANHAEAITGITADIPDLPDWQLGGIELFYEYDNSYKIEKVDGHTAYVNDVPLDDSYTVQIATTLAETEGLLPEGTTGAKVCTQQVNGLMGLPTVTIFDEKGAQMEVSYDETTKTFSEKTVANTITEEQETAVWNAVHTYSLWMIEEVNNRATIAKYFDSSSNAYKTIISMQNDRYMQSHNGYEFINEKIENFTLYNDDLFAVRVTMALAVTRTDGSVRNFDFDQSLIFQRSKDTWKAIEMNNKNIFQPVGKVRLTFMNEETVLSTEMYENDIEQLSTPLLSAPEGKVFSGWVVEEKDENGNDVLRLVFQPDASGHVSIPDGTILEPMTLYPLFEDAGSVSQETPAETETATEGA